MDKEIKYLEEKLMRRKVTGIPRYRLTILFAGVKYETTVAFVPYELERNDFIRKVYNAIKQSPANYKTLQDLAHGKDKEGN